ncbi:hypothetical protein ACFP1I_11365 [Dyadobacter subterraneus]|uniref:Glycosyltransferase RgtA/B/C/D-like domain-containing protein n=1 Tax=Dyadobacter subterraneus TaxID=2773304 RepID=A0ABR9WH75_9BACT|nr:hypothetical protein [Dyadobacter subterraneus]MBE9463519.1 hypothetical protein [Dyadobacter subterraneus]
MKFYSSSDLASASVKTVSEKKIAGLLADDQHYNLKTPLLFLLLFALIAIPRWYYVEHFAVSLPFWDQWDAEGDHLLRPWLEGTFKFQDLWLPHNEHRVLPTRLLTLLSYEISGHWNNLTEARINILLASSSPFLLILLVYKTGELKGIKWLMLPVILTGAVFPFVWENLLVGFQSQFYFLILFTVSALALSVWRPFKTVSFILIFILCVLSVFTMASGIMTPFAVASVYIFHAYLGKKQAKTILFISILLITALVGYLTIPPMPGHEIFKAHSVKELFTTFLLMESWPFKVRYWAALMLWIPTCIALPYLIHHKNFTRYDLLMAGCLLWSLLQAFATSYGRGHDLNSVTSRYADFLCIGLTANAWFALRLPILFYKRSGINFALTLVSILFFTVFFKGHFARRKDDIIDMQNRHKMGLIQIKNVSEYLRTGNQSTLQKPAFQIPYPDPVRLKQMLDNPALRSSLPTFNADETIPTQQSDLSHN